MINHSCEPNAGIKERSLVVANRDIKAWEQITWDYAMTEDSDWKHPCLCGSSECRETIGPFGDLPRSLQKQKKDDASWWLLEKYDLISPTIKGYTSEDIPESVVKKIIELFRYTFSNDWSQYVVCPPCDQSKPNGMRFKASEIYQTQFTNTKGDEAIPVWLQEQVSIVPDCPCCNEKMILYMDPEVTELKIREKLKKDAIISTIEDQQTGELLGFTFGRKWTLREAFEAEEWHHPYAYTKDPFPEYRQPFETFLKVISPAIQEVMKKNEQVIDQVHATTDVFLHNCTITDRKTRQKGLMPALMKKMQSMVPTEMKNIPLIGESEKGSRFERILNERGCKSVEGFLEGGINLMVAHHGNFIKLFNQ